MPICDFHAENLPDGNYLDTMAYGIVNEVVPECDANEWSFGSFKCKFRNLMDQKLLEYGRLQA